MFVEPVYSGNYTSLVTDYLLPITIKIYNQPPFLLYLGDNIQELFVVRESHVKSAGTL